MKSLFVPFLMLLGLVVAACSSDKKPKQHNPMPTVGLMHPLFFQEEISSMYNFPFWFNDSIVKSTQLKTIEWSVFPSEIEDTSKSDAEIFPKKTIRYSFNRSGKLIYIQVANYSEGIIISHQSYDVKPVNKLYSAVHPNENYYGITNNVFLVKPVKWRKKVHTFINQDTDEQLIFIADSKNWGPLSVDSIGKPRPADWLVCGTIDKPEKRYHVRNKVKESSVTTYEYRNSNYPSKITAEDFPFTRARHFKYAKSGRFVGSIDSTFIDNAFVTSVRNSVNYDKNGFILKMTHYKEHAEAGVGYTSEETFAYTFYD